MHRAISSTSQSAIWMYLSKASDDQRPNNLIAVFDTFPRNNDVAPPPCSECDPKLRGSFPNRVLPSSKVLSRALLEQAPSVRSPMPYKGVRPAPGPTFLHSTIRCKRRPLDTETSCLIVLDSGSRLRHVCPSSSSGCGAEPPRCRHRPRSGAATCPKMSHA
jgi:hypothetical protein